MASGWEAEFTIGMDLPFSPMSFADDIRDFYQVATGTQLRFSHEALSGTWEALLDRRADLIVGAAATLPSRWEVFPLYSQSRRIIPWRL